MSRRATALPPDERRSTIVDATLALVVEHGDTVTTRQIAEAAGIAEGTIFRVFPDKHALWLAVAERTLDPRAERDELNEAIAGATDLYTKIERAADHLLQRSQRVMAVMMLLRGMWLRQAEHEKGHHKGEGPPFIVEANRALMAGLTELFEAHRGELAVGPQTAAAVLRSLVLGQRHPGAHADYLLSPAEVAEVMLHGVLRQVT
jgi:AcrR family transcriptional regulator